MAITKNNGCFRIQLLENQKSCILEKSFERFGHLINDDEGYFLLIIAPGNQE
jgi:hypothetical protein